MNSTLASTALVRLLASWTPEPAAAPLPAFDQRLGDWVSAFDAIGLEAAQRTVRTMADEPARRARPTLARELGEALERARGTLERAIAQDALLPGETGYAPWRRRHQELQRQMEQMIGALRAHVRGELERSSVALRQLAALDAAFEPILAPREQALLPATAALLEQRYRALRRDHPADDSEGGDGDVPGVDVADTAASAPAARPAAVRAQARKQPTWLTLFESDWRQALRAELQLRLEPVTGLVEAAAAELNPHP